MTRLLQQSAASLAGEVDNDAPCIVCLVPDFEAKGLKRMIICDHCDGAYHCGCHDPPVKKIRAGLWFCATCQGQAQRVRKGRGVERPGPELRGGERPTYDLAMPVPDDRRDLQAAAGLHGLSKFPTAAEVQGVLQFRWAPKTQEAYAAAYQRYRLYCTEGGLPPEEIESLVTYACYRLSMQLSAETIRRDLVACRQLQAEWRGDTSRLTQVQRAATKIAYVPAKAKLPLTAPVMQLLRSTIAGWQVQGRGRRGAWIRARDWCYFLMGTMGMFRGDELLATRWAQVRFQWSYGEQVIETLGPDAPPPWAGVAPSLTAVVVHLTRSKTGAAQVPVARVSAAKRPFECPVRLLLLLYHRSRNREGFVFTESRDSAARLAQSTMLSRLKRYLAVALNHPTAGARYGLHSMRRGGATIAYQAGLDIEQIKAQGRWKSDAVLRYVKVSDQQVRATSLRVAEAIYPK